MFIKASAVAIAAYGSQYDTDFIGYPMARDGSGNYSLPANSLAIANSTASSTNFNNALNDIAAALTQSVSKDGQTTFTGQFKGYAGSLSAPTWSFAADSTTGWYQSATGALTASISGVKGIEQDATGFSEGAAVTIASAATTNLASTPSATITITGNTSITSFGVASNGVKKYITFAGALQLNYNATSLILPTLANITTAANDTCIALSLGAGNWRVIAYQRASGLALGQSATGVTSVATGTYLSGGPITATGTVSMGNMSAVSRLMGSGSGSAAITDIALGSGLSMSGNTLSATSGGSVTNVATSGYVTGGPITTTGTVTLGNMGAVSRLLGSGSAAATITDITIGSGLTMSGSTLSATEIPSQTGNSGKFLTTNGSTANWGTALSNDLGAGNVGIMCMMWTNASAVASGATIAGSSIQYCVGGSGGALTNTGVAATGTWRNITGYNANANNYIMMQRIS